MTTSEITEDARVELWRFERLLAVHCPPTPAMALATRRDVDLHSALRLFAQGCPPSTALDILL